MKKNILLLILVSYCCVGLAQITPTQFTYEITYDCNVGSSATIKPYTSVEGADTVILFSGISPIGLISPTPVSDIYCDTYSTSNNKQLIDLKYKYYKSSLHFYDLKTGGGNNPSYCAEDNFDANIIYNLSDIITTGKFGNPLTGQCDLGLSGTEHYGSKITNVKPILSAIARKDNFDPNRVDLCSGEKLSLVVTPAGYPDEVYHWQWSADNINWHDTSVGTSAPQFAISAILPNHTDFFDKDIYFRIGYGDGITVNRPFTASYKINYVHCPTITNLNYIAPKCNGDNFQELKVFFDKDLDPDQQFGALLLRERNDKSSYGYPPPSSNLQGPNLLDQTNPSAIRLTPENTNPPSFSFSFPPGKLHDGKSYKVEFLINKNGIGRSIQLSDSEFTYHDPKELIFTVAATNPVCYGSIGSLTITTIGGTPYLPYKLYNGLHYNYFVNGKLVLPPPVDITDPPTISVTESQKDIELTKAVITGGLYDETKNKIKVYDNNSNLVEDVIVVFIVDPNSINVYTTGGTPNTISPDLRYNYYIVDTSLPVPNETWIESGIVETIERITKTTATISNLPANDPNDTKNTDYKVIVTDSNNCFQK